MTVLHVAAGNAYGGIEQMLVTLAATAHPAVRQEFVVSFSGRLERELRALGATVHRLPSPRASRPLMVWKARRAFSALQQKVGAEAVIFHSAWPHAMFAAAARAAGARVGFWQHQPIVRAAWPDRWARLVKPDFAIYNSAYTSSAPAFSGVPATVIHCPVPRVPAIDEAERNAARQVLGAGPGDFVVLMAARFERLKGHDVLIDAARRLPAGSPVRIWIVGGVQKPAEAPFFESVRAQAEQPGLLGVVSLLGERDDVPKLLRLADAYCQPNTRGESFGMAIAEAMRAGLPCIVSGLGGARELVDEDSGVLTPAGDGAAVAEALLMLAADPRLRAEMGRRAEAKASRLTDPAGRLEQLAGILAAQVV